MRFPIKESEIMLLSESVASGLGSHGAEFPAPPVLAADLQADIDEFNTASYAVTAAYAAYKAALDHKDTVLDRLSGNVKKDLRYAENITDFANDKLMLLGWSARRAKHKLTKPGQPIDLEILYKPSGERLLKWNDSPEGGKTAMYRILRRSLDGTLPDGTNGSWTEVASSLSTETVLKNQPAGKRLEFAVKAVNRAGQSIESNAVEITL